MKTVVITDFNVAMLPRERRNVSILPISVETARDLAREAEIVTRGSGEVQVMINAQLDVDLPTAVSMAALTSEVRFLLARYDWNSAHELLPSSIDWWIITDN